LCRSSCTRPGPAGLASHSTQAAPTQQPSERAAARRCWRRKQSPLQMRFRPSGADAGSCWSRMPRVQLDRALGPSQVCGVNQAVLFESCFLHRLATAAAHTVAVCFTCTSQADCRSQARCKVCCRSRRLAQGSDAALEALHRRRNDPTSFQTAFQQLGKLGSFNRSAACTVAISAPGTSVQPLPRRNRTPRIFHSCCFDLWNCSGGGRVEQCWSLHHQL
jgi:hypothetical protein